MVNDFNMLKKGERFSILDFEYEVVLDYNTILNIIDRLSIEIQQNAALNEDAVFVPILTGASKFSEYLFERLKIPFIQDSIIVTSYRGTESSGSLRFLKDTKTYIKDKVVFLLDDIIDTGFTISALKEYFLNIKKAKKVYTCVLLDKKDCRLKEYSKFKPDYVGIEVPSVFLVGWGLDDNDRLRWLNCIVKKIR